MSKDKELCIYERPDEITSPEILKEQFAQDTAIVAEQAELFVNKIHPAYLRNTKKEIMNLSYDDADELYNR